MPLLILLLVLLAVRALTLPGAEQGLAYYLRPDLAGCFDVACSTRRSARRSSRSASAWAR
jgi:SNF family Na+-dependent transporter